MSRRFRPPRRAVHFTAIVAGLLVAPLLSCRQSPSGGGSSRAAGFPSLTLTRVASGFAEPVHITHAGDGSGRLFVVEKRGTIRIVRGGAVLPTPFVDLTASVRSTGSEQGLLSVAFPPNFAARRHFYVNYTGTAGIGDTVVARHTLSADPDVAEAAGGVAVLRVAQPFENHNGGQLAFGPDGFLYVGLGDGGSGGDPFGNGQNLSSLLGKILRLDVEAAGPTYAIPAGNPFGTEVWASGLRNPWRFSFDRATGDLFIGDVGQALFEEIDVQPAASRGGENYGWNVMEGLHCFNAATCNQAGLTRPVAEYPHEGGNCSVTGGFVYRGARLPALRGIYLYADFCSGRIWGLRRNGAVWENGLLLTTALQISSFGEDEAGEVYVADLGGGDIYRVDTP